MSFSNPMHQLFIPKVKAAEPQGSPSNEVPAAEPDIVDPQEELREKCAGTKKITRLWDTLQECTDRVNSRTKTQETCEQELFDYVHAIDHCVAKTLFTRLV